MGALRPDSPGAHDLQPIYPKPDTPLKKVNMRSPTLVIQQPGIAREKSVSATSARPALPDPSALVADEIAAFADDPDFVTALARGLGVLLALSDKKRRMSIAQVSHRTGIPRAAARRSLHTLEKLGFVAADEARRFYLRPRVLSFSHGYLSASPIAVLAQPILDRLSESLSEACSLAMLDGEEIVYIARSSSSRIMSPALNVGRRLPAYCTSMGKVLLAFLAEDERAQLIDQIELTPRGPNTLTARRALLAELARVREAGLAINNEELAYGLRSIAAPVHSRTGEVAAAINLAAHRSMVSMEDLVARLSPALKRTADQLSARIGYRPAR